MKKILIILILLFSFKIDVNAEIKRIVSGNKNAQITIIAYESLTCSHCADFHKDIYPQLKKEYLDTGLAKIEFRHFPLDMAAFNASKIAQCKNDQNLKILEKLYLNQNELWKHSINIERKIEVDGIGSQDQIITSLGGIKFISFKNMYKRAIALKEPPTA